MKPYENYKDSGVPWIGEIPEEWVIKPLYSQATDNKEKNTGNICDNLLSLSYGNIKRKDINTNMGLLPESFETYQIVEEGMTVLRLTDLQNDQRSLRTGFVKEKGIITSAYVGLCPQKTIDPYFLYELLHFYDTIKVFYGLGAGVRQSMKYNELKKLEIALPPLETQQKITTYLDKQTTIIDSLISDKEKLLTLLAEERQAIISEAVTKGLDPHAEMKDSGVEWIGEIPVGWKVVPITKYLDSLVDYRGKTPEKTDDGIFLVTARNIKHGKIDYSLSAEYISEEDYEMVMRRGKPKIGDVLFTTEAPLGQVANVDDTNIALAQRIIKFSSKADVLDNYFLKFWLMSTRFFDFLSSLSTGSTAEGIKGSKLFQLKMTLPPLEVQEKIVQYLDEKTSKIDQITADTKEQIILLKEYRQSLISEVVTGKIEV